MGFPGSGGGGANAVGTATDVALSNPSNGNVLTFNGTLGKWVNATPSGGGGSSFTANKDSSSSGSVTLTAGTSAQLTKFTATLVGDLTVTLSGSGTNAVLELSFIDTTFNGHTITVTNGTFSHVFSYPTYVKYVYFAAWERVL